MAELYRAFKEEGRTLVEILWEQHRFHESRRWSAVEVVEAVRPRERLTELDRMLVWNAGRAEMTAKPSADRMARLADSGVPALQGKDDAVAAVIQSLGTWTRYWNEEEAHHEMGFTQLAAAARASPPMDDATVIDYRKVFPDDDLLRTVTMLSFSEGIAAVNYGQYARRSPGSRPQGAAQARGRRRGAAHAVLHLVRQGAGGQRGVRGSRSAFAVAYFFLREGGELYGSTREHVEHRDTHVNWWDHLEYGVGQCSGGPGSSSASGALILHALRRITGISCASAEEVEDQWMDLVGD